jgi:L-ascorbate metabolism protein UlaG (beta-lactamase superfamily)
MNGKNVFLKPNLVIEPLIGGWYAWSHIISPATASLNITKRHLEIMNSYVESPELHQAAVQNPKMLGGPFIDYKEIRADEIAALIDETLEKQKDLVELSFALKKLNKMLRTTAKGYSMELLYEQVPEILKGYVELVYDLNNQPSFRIFEQLFYKSKYYKTDFQSVALWLTDNDSRPFCLSTPRLPEENVLSLALPFSSPLIDELSKMKRTGRPYEEIKALFGITEAQEPLFRSFFTEEPPTAYKKYEGDKIRMRYFGHACILVETKDVSILVDPLISYYGYQSTVEHFSDYDLPDVIDYVLITHNHQDHILLETLLPLRHRIKNLIVPRSGGGALQDPSLKMMFNAIGFNNVIDLEEMESLHMSDCVITGIPFTGEHSDLNVKAKMCHHVEVDGFTLFFMADSRVIEPKLYEHIQRQIGNVDVIFLGMECDGAPLSWLYGPLMFEEISNENDQSRRLSGSDCEKGMSVINIFKPSEVYVYAMGQEPWCEFISSIKYTDESNPIVQSNKLVAICKEQGIVAERLFGEKEILYNKRTLTAPAMAKSDSNF